MNDFRTIVRIPPASTKMTLEHGILTLGSCFSDAIGARLNRNKFTVSINPFGIIYNPVSLHALVNRAAKLEKPDDESFLQSADIHLNYDFHSSFSSTDKSLLDKNIDETLSIVHHFMKDCNWILITYGTAWVYTLRDSGRIVANCHKQPSNLFDKSLLTGEQIFRSFETMHDLVKQYNPACRFILTASPVRHVKDTLQLNSLSKSILRCACHQISETFTDVEYFPAYEIMMDDLRDYRFYKSDMIHPTEVAEDYIWNRFADTYLSTEALDFIRQWNSIYPALHHRAFHPSSSGHQIFLKQTLHKLEELKGVINVDEEIRSIQTQLLDSGNSKQTSS